MSTQSYYAKQAIHEYYLQLCEELGVDPYRPHAVVKAGKPARKPSKTNRRKRTVQVVALPKA